jgi:tetratricopeptide (TPR) repeat protein
MKALGTIIAVSLVAALVVISAGCGGKTSVTMRSAKVYYHQNKDYPKAEEWFKKAVAEEPNNWEAHFYLALSMAQQGKFTGVGEEFDQAYQLAPDDKKQVVDSNQQTYFSQHFRAGLSAKDTRNFEEAAREFEIAVAVDPTEANGYINLAYVYREMGQNDKALEVMKKSVQVDSTSVYAWSNLGLAYRDMKENDLAAEAFQKVVALSPEEPDVKFGALASLGDIMFDRKEFQKALEYYSQAAEITTEDAALQYQVGATNYQIENYQDAVEAFKKCTALTKDKDPALYSDAMYNLGISYLKLKNYDEAIGTFQTLLQTQESAEIHEMLGSAYGEKGLKEQAIEEFKKARALGGK